MDLKITKLEKIDKAKYKSQTNIRRLRDVSGGFERIVFATDQDLDGFHIRGLLSGFIHKYLPEFKDRIGMLQTPVIIINKNNKIQKWMYNLNDDVTLDKGEVSDYKKGLGSWDVDDLKYIISKDGIDKMVQSVDFTDSETVIDDWLGNDSQARKTYILGNNFNIAKA